MGKSEKKKKIVCWGLGMLLILLLASGGLAYSRDGAVILAYHSLNTDPEEAFAIDPAEFEKQLQYLAAQGYQTASLAELFDDWSGQGALPAKPLVITFDDGYEDNLTTALPILQRYGMKATVFVVAGDVGNPGYMNWEQLRQWQAGGGEIGSHTFSHVLLENLEPEDCRRELARSKAVLETGLGTTVSFLAYPFGSVDYGVVAAMQETGYRGGCAGVSGVNPVGANPYTLRRVNVPRPRCGLLEFRLRLLKAWLAGQWIPVRGDVSRLPAGKL
ncbi:MAG TPA: polysaccharide deacetylase family protein [Patescibacteria group bacterium]|nr:polysaccharide deacetylase family protein [Patescibacteria group bacterium]